MSIEMEIAAIKKAIHATNEKLDKLIELQTIVAQSVTVESEITAIDDVDTSTRGQVIEMLGVDGLIKRIVL